MHIFIMILCHCKALATYVAYGSYFGSRLLEFLDTRLDMRFFVRGVYRDVILLRRRGAELRSGKAFKI